MSAPGGRAQPDRLVVPDPRETTALTMPDGAVVHLRRHGNPDGPRIALSHGNGVAIDAYFPFWRQLLDRYDVVLFDIRDHGWNPVHELAGHTFARMADDFEHIHRGITGAYGDRPVIGAFHSLAAVAALKHTWDRGARWSPLVCFDPPLSPPVGHPLEEAEKRHIGIMTAWARRRPDRFASPAAFAEQMRGRDAFARWQPGSHELFAEATLRPAPDGDGYLLRCPRDFEVQIFETNFDPAMWGWLGEAPVPLAIVGADTELPGSQVPSMVSRAACGEHGIHYVRMPDTTHFLQLERPEEAFAAMEAFLRDHGVAP